jgi:hypothetical protein
MAITIDGADNKLEIGANATGPSSLRLYEDTDNGTNYVSIIAPSAVTSNRTLTLPDATGTLVTNSGSEAGAFSTLAVNSNNISAENSLGFRNRIINGDMRIDQRRAGASVTIPSSAATYTVDRWGAYAVAASKFSVQQSSVVPAGFKNSILITSLAATSVGTADFYQIGQSIEGFNIADLDWGTANAKTVTLSFWVRSSLTGTFGGNLITASGDQSYPFSYTISAANTFEQKTITVVGPTAGTYSSTNGVGVNISFSLGAGSTVSGTAGSWSGSVFRSSTGASQLVATNGATLYITGVQLEVGSVATPFERRPYGAELAMCQRYYQKVFPQASNVYLAAGFCTSTTSSRYVLHFPVEMRTAPTALETSGTAGDYVISIAVGNATCNAAPSLSLSSKNAIGFLFDTASGLTTGQGAMARTNATSAGLNAFLAWSAEL